MSLNYQDIEAAVLSEKDAGGFAKLMKDFQALGVEKYDYLVADGFIAIMIQIAALTCK